MEALVSVAIGVVVAVGVYLLLRSRSFAVVLGYAVLSYGVNLLLFASGRLGDRAAPIVRDDPTLVYMDPLPQALVLTAIVIGLAMVAILLVLALRSQSVFGTDHVDGTDLDDDAPRRTGGES